MGRPRSLSFPLGAWPRDKPCVGSRAHSPVGLWQGLSSNPRNEGLGVASSRNHPPQTLPDALQPPSAPAQSLATTGRRGGGDGVGPRGPKLLVISPTVLLRHPTPQPVCRPGQGGLRLARDPGRSGPRWRSVSPTPPCEGPRPPREAPMRSPRRRPPPPRFCGKEAAGAGVAAGASCPCDRAEQGTRGHVGKTLVPAALPARNAPPAPQSTPAWPRNGDSHAPCSHPLGGAHPAQPTKGLARAPSLPASPAAGPLPASPSFHWASVGGSGDRGIGGVLGRTRLPLHTGWPACPGLAPNSHPFGTYYPRLPPSLRRHSPRDPHTQHKAKNSGQIITRSQRNILRGRK